MAGGWHVAVSACGLTCELRGGDSVGVWTHNQHRRRMARQRGPARICRGYGGRRLASAVAAVAAHVQALAEAAPCSVDCVCEESGGGGESWDLSPISGTYTTTDGDEREYWLDVCGNIDAVPELCLESTPTIDAAMVMRTDGSFCNQMGPSFADLPSDDLVRLTSLFSLATTVLIQI